MFDRLFPIYGKCVSIKISYLRHQEYKSAESKRN